MLDAFIIEEIWRRERDERTRPHLERPAPFPMEPPPRQPPPSPTRDEDDEDDNNGVTYIDM